MAVTSSVSSSVWGFLARRAWFVEDEIGGLAQLVPRGGTCLDVGAEYGLYTHALAALVGGGGQVHSVEPLPGVHWILSCGVVLAGRRNVRCHRLALGERAERGVLSLPRRHGLPVHGRAFLTSGAHGQGPNREFVSSRLVPVEVLTLDQLCAREHVERLDFVKADVEGHEFAVLKGGEATLSAHHPSLLLEIEDRHLAKYGADAQAVIGWLAERGYRMRRWVGGAWRPAGQVVSAGRNYLFM
jgi:FkbM family methyltransferase